MTYLCESSKNEEEKTFVKIKTDFGQNNGFFYSSELES